MPGLPLEQVPTPQEEEFEANWEELSPFSPVPAGIDEKQPVVKEEVARIIGGLANVGDLSDRSLGEVVAAVDTTPRSTPSKPKDPYLNLGGSENFQCFRRDAQQGFVCLPAYEKARSWAWLVEKRRSFKESKEGHQPVPKRLFSEDVLGGDYMNQLLETMRTECARLMRLKCTEEEAEDEGSPTPGASEASGAKRKKGGKWLMEHMPWETVEEGDVDDPPSWGYHLSRDAVDAAVRHIMHHHFGHQSWALHTLSVAMIGFMQQYVVLCYHLFA